MGRKQSRSALWAATLTAGQKAASDQFLQEIKKFRKQCPELSETWCLKFLSVRNYDMPAAVASFKQHVEWRLREQVATVLSRRLMHETQLWHRWPHCYLGRDVEARPVLYMRLGPLDVKETTNELSIQLSHLIAFHIKHQEFLRALCDEATLQEGRNVDKMVYILDLTNVTLTRHLCTLAREFFTKLVETDSHNYPESMGKVILINTGRLFPVIWTFVKNMVDPKTRERIEVFGMGAATDSGGWASRLRSLLPAGQGADQSGLSKWTSVLDPSNRLELPEDERLPTENPTWAMMGYPGPAKPNKLKAKNQRSDPESDQAQLLQNAREDGAPAAVWHGVVGASASTAPHGASEGYAELEAVVSKQEMEKATVALRALEACLEAEGLLGAVQIKEHPNWQCVHCKAEFPLVQLMELQEHEGSCARRAAVNAQSNPVQSWLDSTAQRQRVAEYESAYQDGNLHANGVRLDERKSGRARPMLCCVIQ
mmetsp:Transcript_15155/g.29105  ORF Transcript_15155/g.29105 Transcript_15155/m.29105 type:complete len:483 (+) Transcript_15155:171-1619(+)